jgi:hypothetical protein
MALGAEISLVALGPVSEAPQALVTLVGRSSADRLNLADRASAYH